MRFPYASAVASVALLTALTGCHVSSHKNGDNDNVDIATPFGSVQVKTNDNVAAAGLGITPYPGAQLIKKGDKKDGEDGGSADVNMSFGNFHLGVKAVSYTTNDGQNEVLAFYRKNLAKYGDVIQCQGKRTIGQPTRTAEGLTCDTEKNSHMGWNTDTEHTMELRAGSKQHQHIVAVENKDGGTRIGLVALDFPTNFSTDDRGDHKDSD